MVFTLAGATPDQDNEKAGKYRQLPLSRGCQLAVNGKLLRTCAQDGVPQGTELVGPTDTVVSSSACSGR